jgi:hypothetical protein
MAETNRLEIIGPFNEFRVTINGYRVPYLSAVRHDGLISLSLDERYACDIPDDERALPIIDFITNAMAVAAGYSCFGENSQPANKFKRRLTWINLSDIDDGDTSYTETEQ